MKYLQAHCQKFRYKILLLGSKISAGICALWYRGEREGVRGKGARRIIDKDTLSNLAFPSCG